MESPKPTRRIGEVLVQCGLASEQQVEQALSLARHENIRLGSALVRLGILDEDKLSWALGAQFDLSYVDLDEDMIDWDFLLSLPLERLRAILMVPMSRIDGTIRAVIADPTVQNFAGTLQELFHGRRVVVQLASSENILGVLNEAELRRAENPESATGQNASRALASRIEELGSGVLDNLVIYPTDDPVDLYHLKQLISPAACVDGRRGQSIDALSAREVNGLLSALAGTTIGEFSPNKFSTWIRPLRKEGEVRSIRASAVAGPAGWLVALEAISARQTSSMQTQLHVVASDDPTSLKPMFYAEALELNAGLAEESSLILALENHIEALCPGVFQAELADPFERLTALRYLLPAARPAFCIFELEDPALLPRLQAFCPASATTLIVLTSNQTKLKTPKIINPVTYGMTNGNGAGLTGADLYSYSNGNLRERIRRTLRGEN